MFLCSLAFLAVLAPPALALEGEAKEAGAIFGKRCTACHTYGKGVRVGPDLKGATDRRSRNWLLRFIRSSQSVIQSGDSTAVTLFRQFKQQQMPDWTDLTPQQVEGLLDYFAAGGPEQKTPDERHAETATAADVEMGRRLFHGYVPLANGGQACSACHTVQDSGSSSGGSFGPDLTGAYRKYQDKALTSFLKHPCIPRAPEVSGTSFLDPRESFALKTYLRQLALGGTAVVMVPAQASTSSTPREVGIGSSMLVKPGTR